MLPQLASNLFFGEPWPRPARSPLTTALVCIALLGLLVFGLGFGVSLTHGRTNTSI